MKVLNEEKETVIIYDYLEKSWHLDTTIAKHIHKYRPFLKEIQHEEANYLSGYFDTEKFNVHLVAQKKRELTAEQRLILQTHLRGRQGVTKRDTLGVNKSA